MCRWFKFYIVALMLAGLCGCVKEITLLGQSPGPQMVVESIIDNERPMQVFVTQSSGISGNTAINGIGDALVQLYKNDSLLQALPYVFADTAKTFGVYQSSIMALAGNKYSVRVTHPQYGLATGADVLPKAPMVTSWQLINYGDTTNYFIAKFKINLQDDGADTNYYRINLCGIL